MSYLIYLVEDEANLNQLIASYFQHEGWIVKSFMTGNEAMNYLHEEPDLWVLDIMLPDTDGYQLIKKIREISSTVPVIFISARDQDLDRILGLELGSDDYLAKPFMPRELVIRTRKLLERVYGKSESANNKDSLYFYADYEIDEKKRIATLNGKNLQLTSKEFDILLLFIKNEQYAFSREKIISKIWDISYYGTDRAVDDLIRRLRKKMPKLNIETIYGYGYRLAKS